MAKVPLVVWGTPWGFTAATTTYVPLATAEFSANSNEDRRYILYREAGVFSDLFVRVSANTTTANSTIRTRKNATTNGNMSVTIGSGATGIFEDTTNTDTSAAGDKWAYQCVSGATGTTLTVSILSCMFAATTNTISRLAVFVASTTATTTTYFALTGVSSTGDATENNIKNRITRGGNIEKLYLRVTTNSKAGNTPVRIRKNGANGTVTATIGSSATGDFEDTTNSDSVNPGDDVDIALETSVAGTLAPSLFAVSFESTTDVGWLANASNSALTFTEPLTRYAGLGGAIRSSIATESETQLKTRTPLTLSNLTIHVSANAITGTSTFKMRVNTADGFSICSIGSSATGYFTDSTNWEETDSDDLVNYQLITPAVGGTPTMTVRSMGINTEPFSAVNDVVRALPTETIAASETMTQLAAKTRAIATQTTALSESIVRIKGKAKTLTTETITVGETRDRLAAKTRTRTDTAIIVGETRARLSAKNRPITAQTTTVGAGTVGRIKDKIKSLTAETITIGEARTRLTAKLRPIATQTIALSDSVARQIIGGPQEIIRTISQTIAVSESIARRLVKQRAISTQSTTLSESVARLKTGGGPTTMTEVAAKSYANKFITKV